MCDCLSTRARSAMEVSQRINGAGSNGYRLWLVSMFRTYSYLSGGYKSGSFMADGIWWWMEVSTGKRVSWVEGKILGRSCGFGLVVRRGWSKFAYRANSCGILGA
jgi:hypothetical protein